MGSPIPVSRYPFSAAQTYINENEVSTTVSTSNEESGTPRGMDPEQKTNIVVGLVIAIPLLLLVGYFAYVFGLRDVIQQCPPHCDEVDYSHQDLAGADLSGRSLQSANFTAADLTGASLATSDLFPAMHQRQ